MRSKLYQSFFSKIFPSKTKSEQTSMIEGIKRLSGITAADVMVPRIDVVAIDDSDSSRDVLYQVANSMHTRFPVYHDTKDNVIGLIYVKDLLKKAQNIDSLELNSILRQPFFVPETIRLDKLLHEMKKRRIHLCIVVDEYGGVSGIVSMEDIIEEIIGEIRDEFDSETDECIKIDEKTYIVDGRMSITKLNEKIGLNISDEKCDTVGGFVYHLLGKIPFRYEKVSYEQGSKKMKYIVHSMIGNQIKSVKIILGNGN